MNFIDKASLKLGNRTFLSIITERLSGFDRILVISNRDRSVYGKIDGDFYSDLIKDTGPMGGIYTALTHSESPQLFITTCDMPFITEKHIITICSPSEEYDIVVPSFEGRYEMLFARYSRRCLPRFRQLLEEKRYKITGIFEDPALKSLIVPVDRDFMESLKNINTPGEYSDYCQISE